jgi:hypothetical protein
MELRESSFVAGGAIVSVKCELLGTLPVPATVTSVWGYKVLGIDGEMACWNAVSIAASKAESGFCFAR